MWKYHNITINPGQAWTDLSGVRHPKNWHIWSNDEKAKHSITEITEDTPPDSRLYNWSMDSDGKITSTAKVMDDVGSGDDKVLGLKSNLKNEVKKQQGDYLSQTDWAYVRHYDSGTEVHSNIETWRNAIRTKATEMETAIDNCSSVGYVAKLWVETDKDGKKSGILSDWPELGS